MSTRRDFMRHAGIGAAAIGLSGTWPAALAAQKQLPTRRIPGTQDSLPVVGLGNSNAFRRNDLAMSRDLLRLFHSRGGRYVDCAGPSRFVVGEAAKTLGIGDELFLGTYFADVEEAAMRDNIARLLDLTGKERLDLAHAYPEIALPRWELFRRFREEGVTRYIGVARHVEEAYPAMMQLLRTDTVDFLQVNYSPLETEAQERILPMAMDKGVAVVINRPFINGQYFKLVNGHSLPEWAAEFDCDSWAQFSLKFILSHPAVTCVITETADPDHALDNIGAGFGRLPDPRTRRRMAAHLASLGQP